MTSGSSRHRFSPCYVRPSAVDGCFIVFFYRLKVSRERPNPYSLSSTPFNVAVQLLNHLGYLSWETRQRYDLLQKSDNLLRELKHLDSHSWYVNQITVRRHCLCAAIISDDHFILTVERHTRWPSSTWRLDRKTSVLFSPIRSALLLLKILYQRWAGKLIWPPTKASWVVCKGMGQMVLPLRTTVQVLLRCYSMFPLACPPTRMTTSTGRCVSFPVNWFNIQAYKQLRVSSSKRFVRWEILATI